MSLGKKGRRLPVFVTLGYMFGANSSGGGFLFFFFFFFVPLCRNELFYYINFPQLSMFYGKGVGLSNAAVHISSIVYTCLCFFYLKIISISS